MEAYHAHRNAWHISDAVNGCTCIGCTSVPFHSSGSWPLNTGWVAQRDHWPLEEDMWPPFFSGPVLGARQSEANALLIGLCFTVSIAPLSACQLSPAIPYLLPYKLHSSFKGCDKPCTKSAFKESCDVCVFCPWYSTQNSVNSFLFHTFSKIKTND